MSSFLLGLLGLGDCSGWSRDRAEDTPEDIEVFEEDERPPEIDPILLMKGIVSAHNFDESLKPKAEPLTRPLLAKGSLEPNRCPPAPPTWELTEIGAAVIRLMTRYPFLAFSAHYLNHRIMNMIDAMKSGRDETVLADFAEISLEARLEEETLKALFEKFKVTRNDVAVSGQDVLAMRDVGFMLGYLGLPCSRDDASNLIAQVDQNRDYLLNFEEFSCGVGALGGTLKVFEKRFFQNPNLFPSRGASLVDGENEKDRKELASMFADIGFSDSAQAYWRLVLPRSEMKAVAELKAFQKTALRTIREIAKKNHEAAIHKLQQRFEKIGWTVTQMWMVLAWIREIAPIIVQLDIDVMLCHLRNDTHYRNQFETHTSGGLLNEDGRAKWERDLFLGAYDGPEVEPFDRCKYGVLNVMNDFRGVARTEIYGDSYIILKDVRLRCTFSPRDSGNLKAGSLAVLDYFAHELLEYTDAELKEVVKVASGGEAVVGDSTVITHLEYKEAQIHGEIDFTKHIDMLVVHDRHRNGYIPIFLREVCDKHGWNLSWISEEKERITKPPDPGDLKEWNERFWTVVDPTGVIQTKKEGQRCRFGCGRPVRAGKTHQGKSFTTCCAGCLNSEGKEHDKNCQAEGTARRRSHASPANPRASERVNAGISIASIAAPSAPEGFQDCENLSECESRKVSKVSVMTLSDAVPKSATAPKVTAAPHKAVAKAAAPLSSDSRNSSKVSISSNAKAVPKNPVVAPSKAAPKEHAKSTALAPAKSAEPAPKHVRQSATAPAQVTAAKKAPPPQPIVAVPAHLPPSSPASLPPATKPAVLMPADTGPTCAQLPQPAPDALATESPMMDQGIPTEQSPSTTPRDEEPVQASIRQPLSPAPAPRMSAGLAPTKGLAPKTLPPRSAKAVVSLEEDEPRPPTTPVRPVAPAAPTQLPAPLDMLAMHKQPAVPAAHMLPEGEGCVPPADTTFPPLPPLPPPPPRLMQMQHSQPPSQRTRSIGKGLAALAAFAPAAAAKAAMMKAE